MVETDMAVRVTLAVSFNMYIYIAARLSILGKRGVTLRVFEHLVISLATCVNYTFKR